MAKKIEVSPKQIRKARAFLYKHDIPANQISPKKFAEASAEQDTSFKEMLRYLSRLLMAGQNESITRKELIREAVK